MTDKSRELMPSEICMDCKPRQDYRGDFLGTILCAVHRRPAADPIASRCNTDAIDPRDEQIRKLTEALEKLRRKHDECEDSWYSCPKSEDGCSNDGKPKDSCDCLADYTNGIIDTALSTIPPSSTKTEGE